LATFKSIGENLSIFFTKFVLPISCLFYRYN
jgi:hypothetical protein